ncbi:FecR family protein [Dyadobacter tibetensis]|uniref:FecR family protein n=1 Tax=Dyadobacter tibetensis TaxID=1211851 RepID=UPI0004BC2E35|nr:FecR family protein [Dyadobacter tibetensis]
MMRPIIFLDRILRMDLQNKQHLKELIRRYVEGTATEAERQFVDRYYTYFEDHPDILDSLHPEQQNALGWAMADHISENISDKSKVLPLWKKAWFSAAASILIILTLVGSLYWMSSSKEKTSLAQVPILSDFEPGSNVATLTLSDGSKLQLDGQHNGPIAQQGDVAILKREDGLLEYDRKGQAGKGSQKPILNTISTPAGGQYRIVLPDGTQVWLNAKSSIEFPTFFAGNSRKVRVTGECFFDVATNADLPFIVNIQDREEVVVTGTAFNISAYLDDSEIQTTLVEGSIQLGPLGRPSQVSLKPGDQASLNEKGHYELRKVDLSQTTAWKEGLFQFHNDRIEVVMNQIARWYNVEVEYAGNIPQKTFSGKIHRNVNASQILEIITFAGVNFKMLPSNREGVKGKILVTQ